MKKVRFGLIDTKESFLEKLANSEIDSNMLVFIQDTREIWTKGDYYGCVNLNLYNGLDAEETGTALDAVQGRVLDEKITSVKNIIENEIGLPDVVKQSHVVLSEDEYNSRLESGTILDDVFYYIPE